MMSGSAGGTRTSVQWLWAAVFMVCAVVAGAAVADAQPPRVRGRGTPGSGPTADARVSPAEIQRLFDAYVLMQAQEALHLTDDQYPPFLARVKALQDVRRQAQVERARLVQVLRRLTQAQTLDETQTRATLKQLTDLDARAADDIRQALDGIDQVLDVRQQARFRIFEEQMERRKMELLLRARQANRRATP